MRYSAVYLLNCITPQCSALLDAVVQSWDIAGFIRSFPVASSRKCTSKLGRMKCAVFSLQFAVSIVYCALLSSQCVVFNVQCVVCSM